MMNKKNSIIILSIILIQLFSYNTNSVEPDEILQNKNQVYECQEYQTLDEQMQTIDMSFICRKLVQPYKTGMGT